MSEKQVLQEGNIVGSLTYVKDDVFYVSPRGEKLRKCIFICQCGNEFSAVLAQVNFGSTTSCGCKRRQNKSRVTHGCSPKKLQQPSGYKVWCGIKYRCLNPASLSYKYYGAVGIGMCPDWAASFSQFISDMGPRPSNSHTIDRIDNTKGYFKDNCRWATNDVQSNNRSTNRFIEYRGSVKTITQWCSFFDIKRRSFQSLLDRERKSVEYAFVAGIINKLKNSRATLNTNVC